MHFFSVKKRQQDMNKIGAIHFFRWNVLG